ncbi:MAG TPA: hypothetical protein VKT70_10005 [Stellaceae bacterium]|nr:hypothetical protein [Stellaceae bacterium]
MLWSIDMVIYKLRLFDGNGRVVAVQRLSAASDDEALSIIHGMFEKTSVVARFDLWEGERRVKGSVPRRKPRR